MEMAKRKTQQSIDLDQAGLFDLLDQQPDTFHKLTLSPNDIGAELISILSKGLYTNPLDCIREYIQNSVDAGANNIRIKVTGNSVSIHDNGRGMDFNQLLQARQFGLSFKDLNQNAGFRGIGIYSGFDICKRLEITTKAEGESKTHVLKFEFATMKSILEKEKNENPENKTSLISLLTENTSILRDSTNHPLEMSFTTIKLSEISEVYINQVSDRQEVKKYLYKNLPIDFSEDFPHRQKINSNLFTYDPSYKSIVVELFSDKDPDEIVVKKYDKDLLAEPVFEFILDERGNRIAYLWGCLNMESKSLDSDYSGFVYKMKGFTIGNKENTLAQFTARHLFYWWTGEIYVLDNKIIPNAERNDFESSPAKANLLFRVGLKFKELEEKARTLSAKNTAIKAIIKHETRIPELMHIIDSSSAEKLFEVYSELSDIQKDLKSRKKDAAEKRESAETLLKTVDILLKKINKSEFMPSQTTEEKPKRQRKPKQSLSEQLTGSSETVSENSSDKTLSEILQENGLFLDDGSMSFVAIIQAALEDVLNARSPAYKNLIKYVEFKIKER
jgi:hypothetical protein